MEYRCCIVNELDEVIEWCANLSEDEVETLLDEHPEYHETCYLV